MDVGNIVTAQEKVWKVKVQLESAILLRKFSKP